jgi:hypothetical protein
MIRYGQIVKLLTPQSLRITASFVHFVKQFETKFKVEDMVNNYTYKVLIPAGTLGILSFIHIDGTHEQVMVGIPNPITNKVFNSTFMCKLKDITFDVPKEEKETMKNSLSQFLLTKKKYEPNLDVVKQIHEIVYGELKW